MTEKTFEARLESDDDGRSCYFEVPFDVKATFGKARAPVIVTLQGFSFPSTVAVYGGRSLIPVRRDRRESAGVEAGQRVRVKLALDESTRTVKPPKELAAQLKRDKTLRAAWDRLSYSHRREHAEAIESAKRPETRERRVQQALAMLRSLG